MAGISPDRIRAEVRELLPGVDLRSTSVGQLRAALEASLGLQRGALDTQKDEVQRIFSCEIAELNAADTSGDHVQKEDAQKKPGVQQMNDDKKQNEREQKEKRKVKDKKVKKESGKVPKEASDDKKKRKVDTAEESLPEAAGLSSLPASKSKVDEEIEEDGLEAEEAGNDSQKVEVMESIVFDNWHPPAAPATQEEPTSISQPVRHSAMVLSGSEDGTVRLWDLESETKCIRVLEGHTGTVHSLVVSWETFEAVSGADDSSKLWNLKLGGCQKTAETPEGCTAVEADWKRRRALAGCGDGSLRVWSMSSAELQKTLQAHRGGVWALQADFSANRLVSAGDQDFKVWDLHDWTCLHTSVGHAGGLMCISVNWAKSQLLAGAGSSTSRLQLWSFDSEDDEPTTDHKPTSGPHQLQGKRVVDCLV